jgi:hypothetical protein
METSVQPIKVFMSVPTITQGQFREVLIDGDSATLESVLRKLVEDNEVPVSFFLESDQWKKDYIMIVNGTITRNPSVVLKDQDRVLLTTMMGGG